LTLRPTSAGKLVGRSAQLVDILATIDRIARSNCTVLVTGESGTGKEVVASAIHDASPRTGKSLVVVNCGAIPGELLESELFGHAKGAFTGALSARNGYFQSAHGGTLFIDEVGELPPALQVKLLRALQSGEVQPVGGHTEQVDVRVVAATNRELAADVKAGRFREDLFYRLDVVSIRVPPLRERSEDIVPLATSFVRTYAERYGMGSVEIEPALLEAFQKQSWPGNVRELENTIARLLAVAADDKLTLALFRSLGSPHAATFASPDPGPSHPLRRRVEAFERSIIAEQFEAAGKNQSETARRLGISRPALIEKLHKYGLVNGRDS